MTSEEATRKSRIDPRLSGVGWSVVPFTGTDPHSYAKAAVEEFETASGPADYALCDADQILGVVEAKKLSLGPQGVLVQAERYSKRKSPLHIHASFRYSFSTAILNCSEFSDRIKYLRIEPRCSIFYERLRESHFWLPIGSYCFHFRTSTRFQPSLTLWRTLGR